MSAPSWAAPGVMVVCVHDDWSLVVDNGRNSGIICPVAEIVYTIRYVRDLVCPCATDSAYLTLEEIRNSPDACSVPHCALQIDEPGFAISCFRPVKTTNIEDLVSLTRTPPTELPLLVADASRRRRAPTREFTRCPASLVSSSPSSRPARCSG
jgi:hypothetical protein